MLVHSEFEAPKVKSKEQQSAELRAAMPGCAEIIDQFKSLFGDVTVLACTEGEKVIKPKNYKSDNDYRVWIGVDRYLELGKLSDKAFEVANRKVKDANRK